MAIYRDRIRVTVPVRIIISDAQGSEVLQKLTEISLLMADFKPFMCKVWID